MKQEPNPKQDQEKLDRLLSMRGKPFADWKEERKYLREKWGMQGKELKAENIEAFRKKDNQTKISKS